MTYLMNRVEGTGNWPTRVSLKYGWDLLKRKIVTFFIKFGVFLSDRVGYSINGAR
jgi:hypothetical protein